MEPGDSRYPGGLGEPGTERPKRDQETERTASARSRAKGTAASENPRFANCPEPSEIYPEPSAWNKRRENQEAQRSHEDCGIRELGGIGETGRSKVPNVRRVSESKIRDMPRIATWPARSDDMKLLFLSNLCPCLCLSACTYRNVTVYTTVHKDALPEKHLRSLIYTHTHT